MHGRWRDGRSFDPRRMALRESPGVCATRPAVRLNPVLALGGGGFAAPRAGASGRAEGRDRPPGLGERA